MDPPLRHWLVVYSLWFVPEVSEAGEIDTGFVVHTSRAGSLGS